MSEPDFKLGGLSLRVRDRTMPDVSDYWDGDWLTLRTTMHVGQSSVTTEGSILMASDFERFGSELARLHASLTGEATLSGYEPNLKVTLRAGSLGQIGGVVEITPDQMSEFHRFDVDIDQTYIPSLIAACEAIVERFPVEAYQTANVRNGSKSGHLPRSLPLPIIPAPAPIAAIARP